MSLQKKKKNRSSTVKPHNTARIIAKKVLPNIGYNGLKTEDSNNRSFIFYVFVLLTKNMNPFSAERKFIERNY